MPKTSDEILYKFAYDVEQLADDLGSDWDEKVQIFRRPSRSELFPNQSGESEWNPAPPEPMLPGADKWRPEPKAAPQAPPAQQHPDSTFPEPPDAPEGESEWYNPEVEYDYEEEMARRYDADVPDPDEYYEEQRGYKYHPDEKPVAEHSDAEVLEMIKADPMDVVTNQMLHRKPEYQKIDLLMPMARGMVDFMSEANISPEKGTLLYEETTHILNLLEKLADEADEQQQEA